MSNFEINFIISMKNSKFWCYKDLLQYKSILVAWFGKLYLHHTQLNDETPVPVSYSFMCVVVRLGGQARFINIRRRNYIALLIVVLIYFDIKFSHPLNSRRRYRCCRDCIFYAIFFYTSTSTISKYYSLWVIYFSKRVRSQNKKTWTSNNNYFIIIIIKCEKN